MFMNRSSALYNSCLQTELLRYVYKKQFNVVFMFTHSLLVRDKIIKDFRTQLQLFMFQKCIYRPFLKCVFINLKIRSGMVEA